MGHGKAQKREDLPCLRVFGVDILRRRRVSAAPGERERRVGVESTNCVGWWGCLRKSERTENLVKGLMFESEELGSFNLKGWQFPGGARAGQLMTVGMESVGGFEGENVSGDLVVRATR